MEKARKIAESIMLTGRLLEFRNALESEIEAIENTGQSSTLLTSGRRMKNSGVDYWYCFKVEYMPAVPPDTPCKLTIERNTYNVTVVSLDENEIVISSNTELPDNMSTAKLENGSVILMERLIKRIEDNSEKENTSGNRMLPIDGDETVFSKIYPIEDFIYSDNLTDAQKKAVKSALSNDITYIWGPPGTGKTTVIGDIIINLYKNNRSVLVVSHTNVAVDGAIEKVVKEKDYGVVLKRDDGSCPVLRLGNPKNDLPKEVRIEDHIQKLGSDLYTRKDEIENEQKRYRKSCKELALLIDKINWIEVCNIDAIRDAIEEEKKVSNKVREWNYELEKQRNKESQFISVHPEVLKYNEYKCEEQRLNLKLEKMAALITTKKEREAVDAYFENKMKDRENKKRGNTSKNSKQSVHVAEGEQLSFTDLGFM